MNKYAKQAVLSAREALLISALDAAASVALLLAFSVRLIDSYGFIILVESAVLMLAGGALSFVGQAGVRNIVEEFSKRVTGKKINPGKDELERNELRAALYAMTGAILFVEGIVLTAILS